MLSQLYIKVCEDFGEEECEVPLEDDGTLQLATLQSCFPGATGLKFRNPLSNVYRAVKIDCSSKFHPPGICEDDLWACKSISYICVFPKSIEPKVEETPEPAEKVTKTAPAAEEPPAAANQPKTVDLIILNLSPLTAEDGLRSYFETRFGPLLMAEVKRDRKAGTSRRFAFIRFKSYKDQMKALAQTKHKIDNQQVRVALPDYRDPSELYQENKCFIGRVNEAIKSNDLREFFSQFGEIVEVSYPKKFKGYAFVTFSDPEVARKICGQDFVIKGYSVCVSKSTNGSNSKMQQQPAPPNMGGYGGGHSGYDNDWNNAPMYSRNPWASTSSNYTTAPLNPPMDRNNFYGNSAALSAMGNSLLNSNNPLNVLSMAMGNLMNNHNHNHGMQNVSLLRHHRRWK